MISKHEGVGIKHYKDSKAFIEYTNDLADIYENLEEFNLNNDRQILIAFDDLIADMLSNKKLQQIVTERQ